MVSSITSTCLSTRQLWIGGSNGLVRLYGLGDMPRLLAVYGLPGAAVARLVCGEETAAAVAESLEDVTCRGCAVTVEAKQHPPRGLR